MLMLLMAFSFIFYGMKLPYICYAFQVVFKRYMDRYVRWGSVRNDTLFFDVSRIYKQSSKAI